MKIYSPVLSSLDVIVLFAKFHEQLGFPFIEYSVHDKMFIKKAKHWNKSKNQYEEVTVDFEYLSSDYLLHNRQISMSRNKKHILVCWEDDCKLNIYLQENYKNDIQIIELKNHVEFVNNIGGEELKPEYKYYLINYDLAGDDYKSYVDWKNSRLFRFKGNHILIGNGSKALIKDGDHIIGGFDIVRYENIWIPNDRNFIESYKRLTDYPVGLVFLDCDEVIEKYANQNVNHIFYSNFFELNNKKLRKTIKEILPNFETSDCVVQALTEEEYNKLLGIDKKCISKNNYYLDSQIL